MMFETHQKCGLPIVQREPVSLLNKWAFVDIPLFHARVFLFVGSMSDMRQTARSCIRDFEQSDSDDVAMFIENYCDSHCDCLHTNGDAFGQEGTAFIRVSSLSLNVLDDVLVLNHECLHAALGILDWVGIESKGEHETLCYTHEFIFGRAMKEFSKPIFSQKESY